MKITSIQATAAQIILHTDATGPVTLREYAPVIGQDILISQHSLAAQDGFITLPRMDGQRDRLFSRYQAAQDGQPIGGVMYVTHLGADVPRSTAPYPQPATKRMLGMPAELVEKYHIPQGLMNINLPALMTLSPSPEDIPFDFNGQRYFARRSEVEKIDGYMKAYPMMTAILLNAPRLFGSTGEKALLDICIHPHYDWDCSNAYISAFDMETPDGQAMYMAFVSFLAERYTRPDGQYGRLVGAIVSNEVNSQYVWGNAGDMDVADYVTEYAQALRLTWLCGQRYASAFRVYISLDQFWSGTNFDPTHTTRYYSGRTMLDLLAAQSSAQGEFPWNVAFHPYPEDLRWPDFWHDRTPDFTFSTGKITFKNMEVLEAYLAQPQMLYRGQPRRIIFSEQGFNSHTGPLQRLTEEMAAAGYVLAYMKARGMATVDLFTHHATVDNPHEFGLNLGMFRYDPDAPHHMGEAKPIFQSFLAMDSDSEPQAVANARAFIGEELFDYLLHPPITRADRDTTHDNEFGA